MSKGYIYFLHNGDFQPRYIGMTMQTPEQRLARHGYDANRGLDRPVYNWIRKHGLENISVCALSEAETVQDLFYLERFYIAQEKAHGAALLNCTDGGEGAPGIKLSRPRKPHTEERKRKVADKMRGNTHGVGHVHTPEAKAKMSASRKGKPMNAPAGSGLHTRWHVNRSITKPDCNFCKETND